MEIPFGAVLTRADWPLLMEPEQKWYRTGEVETGVHQFLVQDPDDYPVRDGGAAPSDVSGWKASGVDERVDLVRQVAGSERFGRLELNALVQRVVMTEERPDAAAEELAGRWTQLTPDEILQSPFALVGTLDQMVEDLLARRERWGISCYVIFEPYREVFAPIVARLAGP